MATNTTIEGVTWRITPLLNDTEAIEKIWNIYNPPFNTIRFEIDITESPEKYLPFFETAHKLRVHLLPILKGVIHFHGDKWHDFSENVGMFVKNLGEGLEPATYRNIVAYQLENELNHWLLHHREIPQLHKDEQQQLLIDASLKIREIESHLNRGYTPLMVNYSFDTIFYRSFNWKKSYEDYFKPYMSKICNRGNIDVVAIDWYPGTWTPGKPEDLIELMQIIINDFTQKVMIAETGYSTGKQTEDKQLSYYQRLRELLSELNENFFGVCWYELFDGSKSHGLGLNPFSFIEDNFGLIRTQEGPMGSTEGSPKKVYRNLFQAMV